jgi:heat shock transcription factor, other eukaryote
MQTPLQSRKRPAPGASPVSQQRQNMAYPQVQDVTKHATDQYPTWDDPNSFGHVANAYSDPSAYDNNMYNYMADGMNQANGASGPNNASTQLVRRNGNQQLAAVNRNTWQDFGAPTQPAASWAENSDDDEDLHTKAMAARKEAQAKRKQIPPFVQKLSRYSAFFFLLLFPS